ncbi:MAG: septum site-determining protein MinC [Synergistaceae bacterium]|nr:septum site-determining protein MinC [Synergistaceae bacterium]
MMVHLKGIQTGILQCVVPEELSEKKILEEFEELTASAKVLLEGSTVVMDMQGRSFGAALVAKIWKYFIEPTACSVISWIVTDPETAGALGRMGITVGDIDNKTRKEKPSARKRSNTLLHTGTLRGGQKILHDGDVIITGHVNVGSEISANGHIVVLGRLKGLVHAGCKGDETASVSARSFESGQVRIGRKVGLIDKSSDIWGKAVVITVNDNEVLLTEWPAI